MTLIGLTQLPARVGAGQNWRETHGTLVVGLDRSRMKPKDAMRALWDICPQHNLVVLDHFVDVGSLSDAAWRTLGNVDWRRDIEIRGGPVDHFDAGDKPRGQIGIDATSKGPEDGHPRGWPEEIEMTPEIKARVDKRWKEYGMPG